MEQPCCTPAMVKHLVLRSCLLCETSAKEKQQPRDGTGFAIGWAAEKWKGVDGRQDANVRERGLSSSSAHGTNCFNYFSEMFSFLF